jgi:Icc-related predicted phosphoesterase
MRITALLSPRHAGVAAGICALALGLSARADDDNEVAKDFDAYQKSQENVCVGPIDGKMTAPLVFDLGGFHYAVEGPRARVSRTSTRKGTGVRIGILNAIKDSEPKTLANVDSYLARFKEADVDGIVVGGDTAYDEEAIQSMLEKVAGLNVPVYAIIGNAESTGSWNRAARAAHESKHNVLNLDFVRVVNADGFDLVSLPGYYNRHYAAQIAPCVYKPEDASQLSTLAAGLKGPVFAISHGPPKQSGKLGIDSADQAGNVGDTALAEALAEAKIPFGIFGHIVEAGGHATDLLGKKELKAGVLADSFYLNPGSANSSPWRMNTGPETWGMASVVTVEGRKAKYDVIRTPKPAP